MQTGFRTVTFVALWLTGPALYALLRSLHFPPALALLGLPMFYSLRPAVAFNLWDFWLTDASAFLFLTLAITAAVQRRPVRFTLLLAVGVLCKESVLFAAPLWYTLQVRYPIEPRRAIQTAILTVPAVAVLITLRLLIPAGNGDPAYITTMPTYLQSSSIVADPYTLHESFSRAIAQRDWFTILQATVGTFGPLFLLTLWAGHEHWLRWSPLIVLALAQLALAVNTERLVVLAFPSVITMELSTVKALASASLRQDYRHSHQPHKSRRCTQ
jgi:hypothetical protein